MHNPQTEPGKYFSVMHSGKELATMLAAAQTHLNYLAHAHHKLVAQTETALQETLRHDMRWHQAAASACADIAQSNVLLEENAVLARELGRVQERCTRLLTEKSGEIAQLNAQLMQIRSENIGKENTIVLLRADLAALQASIPELESRQHLQHQIEQMSAHQITLETQLGDLRQRLAVAVKTEAAGTESVDVVGKNVAEQDAARSFPVTLHFHKTVLCVGGHMGRVATYRDLIERVGGRFAHHAGGVEDSQSLLDANLAAADLVICQTGCISHNAYWRVQDFCKRTGKRCIFVENPGASSVARGLEQFSVEDIGVIPAENASVESANEIDR
ncbi:MAG: DUF2325 domain-containing protein [Candidatus Nitrotoga sp.]